MRVVLSVDPGKASGIAMFTIEPKQEPVLVWSGEYQMREYAEPIRNAIAYAAERDIKLDVVCERFTITAATVRNTQAPYSLEQIGILRQLLLDGGLDPEDIYFQSPADAKKMFPNEALKKLEYWHRGGAGHALDAIRHGLLRLARSGWSPIRLIQ
jgi:hypothetical protein